MLILLKSEKWAQYRDYCYKIQGIKMMTFAFDILTVFMTPILSWIMRRGENAIQFLFGVRTLAKFPTADDANSQSNQFLESIVVIYQQCEIPSFTKKDSKRN